MRRVSAVLSPRRAPLPLLTLLAACAVALAAVPPAVAAGTVPATRIGGATRFDTAAAASRASYPATASAVVIANGSAWADALGGSALAGVEHGPVLLTARDALSPATAAEVARLKPIRVFILGGTASVAPAVATQLARIAPGATVERLGGSDRYATADAVAYRASADAAAAPTRVFVVTGTSFADALSCSAPAAANGWPILLANPRDPARVVHAVRALGVADVTIVGGTRSVPAATSSALADAVGAAHVSRITGADRYEVSAAVADFSASQGGMGFAAPVVASGAVAADGLAAGPPAALRRSPLLLVAPRAVPEPVAARLFAHRAEVAALAFVGGTRTLPAFVLTETLHALRAPAFSAGMAMGHVRALTGMGVRLAGTPAESAAASYTASQLAAYGYTVTVQAFPIPGGRISHNIIAEKPGRSNRVVVLGAHMDSEPPSPGGNDNGSGVGTTLELARDIAQVDELEPTVRFVIFGAEEISGVTGMGNHPGSDFYVATLTPAEKSRIASMVSIDMVGVGTEFDIRNMQRGPMTTVNAMRAFGAGYGEPLKFLKDPGRWGWSDHEAFEFAGLLVAWLEWRDDTLWHTKRDTASRVSPELVRRSGRLVRGWLLELDAADLRALRP